MANTNNLLQKIDVDQLLLENKNFLSNGLWSLWGEDVFNMLLSAVRSELNPKDEDKFYWETKDEVVNGRVVKRLDFSAVEENGLRYPYEDLKSYRCKVHSGNQKLNALITFRSWGLEITGCKKSFSISWDKLTLFKLTLKDGFSAPAFIKGFINMVSASTGDKIDNDKIKEQLYCNVSIIMSTMYFVNVLMHFQAELVLGNDFNENLLSISFDFNNLSPSQRTSDLEYLTLLNTLIGIFLSTLRFERPSNQDDGVVEEVFVTTRDLINRFINSGVSMQNFISLEVIPTIIKLMLENQ